MASFYLDQNVSHRIVPILRTAGHFVITSRDLRAERARDDEQLFTAWQNRWILVTQNRADFILIHDALRRWADLWGIAEIHAGILLVSDNLDFQMLARILDIFAASELTIANALYDWKGSGGWVRR
ncbi:MAG: DUF5615 family PIN-like protein [Thermomicrobiales bacterium]